MLNYIRLLRPKHWIKNLFLFAAPFFGGTLFFRETLLLTIPVFLSFSFCASAVYIYNDITDVDQDRLHPGKKKRPIASGIISKKSALLFSILLAVIALSVAYRITLPFFSFMLSYFVIQLLYSHYLKHIAIADIFCIAAGFMIRVLAGGAAFHITVSQWLLLTMFMLSLVLATGKRFGEVSLLNEKVEAHRKSLTAYSVSTLNEILIITSSTSLVMYALYTMEQFQRLVYTVPVVTFGLFRYLLISKKGIGDPTEALMKDKLLAVTVALWLLFVGLLRYG